MSAASLDHLVGRGQQCLWDGEAERLGSLEVDDEFEFRRKLHREIARLRPTQNAIDVSGGATNGVYSVGSEGE